MKCQGGTAPHGHNFQPSCVARTTDALGTSVGKNKTITYREEETGEFVAITCPYLAVLAMTKKGAGNMEPVQYTHKVRRGDGMVFFGCMIASIKK